MFKSKLDGGDKPLVLQSGLSKDHLREKEYRAFDQPIENLEHYWTGSLFDGFEITPKRVICGADNLEWDDFQRVKEFYKSPIQDLDQYCGLQMKPKICIDM